MNYEQKLWLEQHKHEIIAYTIMASMIIGYLIYLYIAYKNGWDLNFG